MSIRCRNVITPLHKNWIYQLSAVNKMQNLENMKLLYNLSRGISTCCVNCNKYAAREGKFMTKIMREERGRRKWFVNSHAPAVNTAGGKTPISEQNNRRNDVLNKLFMRHITDLMATGEVAKDILGKGIEISKVNVSADFHHVNVYWVARDSSAGDKEVEEILVKTEKPLRHELSQLRLMGVVPHIKFVQDKQYIKALEIDRLLAVADFGEDFVPTDPTLRHRFTPVMNVKLPAKVWTDIEKLEQGTEEDDVEEPMPVMRNDVLGLDQARIMAKVKSSMDKSRTAYLNRALNISSAVPDDAGSSSSVIHYLSVKQRNEAFSAFLVKRQVEEKQRSRRERNQNEEDERCLLLPDQSDEADNDDLLNIDIYLEKFEEKFEE